MEEQERMPRPFEAVIVIIGGFISSFMLIIALGALLVFFYSEAVLEEKQFQVLILLIGELGLGIFPIAYLLFNKYPLKTIFRLKLPEHKITLFIIPLAFGLTIVGDEMDRILGMFLTPPEQLKQILELLTISTFSEFLILFTGIVFIAAVVEEALFRGLLQISLEKYANVTQAVILASLAWAITHLILFWTIQIFLLGIVLGYLAWRTKSLLPSIICHAINNGSALLVNNVNSEKLAIYYEWHGHVSPLILVPALIVLVYGLRYLDGYYRGKFSGGTCC